MLPSCFSGKPQRLPLDWGPTSAAEAGTAPSTRGGNPQGVLGAGVSVMLSCIFPRYVQDSALPAREGTGMWQEHSASGVKSPQMGFVQLQAATHIPHTPPFLPPCLMGSDAGKHPAPLLKEHIP